MFLLDEMILLQGTCLYVNNHMTEKVDLTKEPSGLYAYSLLFILYSS